MNYKITNLINDEIKSFVSSLKDTNISFTDDAEYVETERQLLFDLEYDGSYSGRIYNFGDRFYFEAEADLKLLDIFEQKIELKSPINVFELSENGILMVNIKYNELFDLSIGDTYYELDKSVWVEHTEKYNPGFNLYNSFKWFEKMSKGFIHIDIVPWLKEETVDVPLTINGVELVLKSDRHFPINNINERENNVEFPEFDEKLIIINRTENELLWESDQELYERYGVKYDEFTKLWTSTIDNKANKLLVSFPGFGGEKYNYPISTFKAVSNYNKLIFADVYGNKGSYLSVDNDGKDLSARVIKKIKDTMAEFNIEEKDVVFTGISKGASAAIRYGIEFGQAEIHAICPQLDIAFFTRNFTLMNYFLKNSQQKYEVNYDLEQVNLYIAEIDKPSHQNRKFIDNVCNITMMRNYPHIEGGYHAANKVISLLTTDEKEVDGNGITVDFNYGSKNVIKVSEPIIYAELVIPERKLAVSLEQKNNKLVLAKAKRAREIVNLEQYIYDEETKEVIEMIELKGEIMYITESGKRTKVSNIRIGQLK